MRRSLSLLCATLFAASLASTLSGCGRPSADDCNKAVDHLLQLILQAGPPESQDVQKALQANFDQKKGQFLQECKEQGTKKDVECMLGAKTWDGLQKNCSGSFGTK